jgi:hypothetical protein
MGPGVPGMGIASIFYVMAALISPLREVVKSVRGESSAQRWMAVGRQFALAVGIVSSIVLLYLGIDAMVSRGLISPPDVADLPGHYPNWAYAVGVLIALLLALVLAAWVVKLRVRWGSIGDDAEMIADTYRASIPVHEDLRQHGISRGRHRAALPQPVISLSVPWHDPAVTNVTTATHHLPMRGRHLPEPVSA